MVYSPPNIDQRTYEGIVKQIEGFAENITNQEVGAEEALLIGGFLGENITDEELGIDAEDGKFIDENLAQNLVKYANKNQLKSFKIRGWKRNNGQIDAGEALIRIFATMVKSVSDRLNQVPEKNFLAFLDLIGGKLMPPQPAKVPLTFYLAEGSPVDGLVPAYTQVSALPAEGSDEEIVFETDRELVVTTAQLKAVFVREPSQDKYSDRSLEATGQKDEAFLVFTGDRSIEHSLYLTCPEIFNLPELENLNLIITTDNTDGNTDQFSSDRLNWFYWDGSQWQEEIPTSTTNGDKLTFTFTNLPIPTASEIDGKTDKWLKAEVTNVLENPPKITDITGEISISKSDLVPDVCLFNSSPLDLTKDFYPFGEQPAFNDTFYIALDESYIKPDTDTTITLGLICQSISPSSDLNIVWEIGDGEEWKEIYLEVYTIESTAPETKDNSLTPNFNFPIDDQIEKLRYKLNLTEKPLPSTVNGETRYWIRARIKKGHYGKIASERKYPIYDDLAILTKEINKEATEEIKEIEVDNLDLFQAEEPIRILPSTGGFPEENIIEEIRPDENKLILKKGIINDNLTVGTRIMRKLIITETIPPTYDPPLIQSLTLSYEFTLPEEAVYLANNDFIYSYPNDDFRPFTPTLDTDSTLYLGFDQSFGNKTVTLYAQVEPPSTEELSKDITTETFLTQGANAQQKILKLDDVTGWEEGDIIEIKKSKSKEYSSYTISNIAIINIDNNKTEITVTVKENLQENYIQGSRVIYSTQPELIAEYSSDLGWQILDLKDETKSFSQRGLIQFIAPADLSKIENFGQELYWLRVRWQGGNFIAKPRLRRLLTNTIWAVQANTIREEILGSSNADPNQVFVANNSPILQGQQLEVEEGQIPAELESDRLTVIQNDTEEIEEVWVTWEEVGDFYSSGASDRHYTLDRQTGEIKFGDGIAGMIPPRGRNNIRLSLYRTGGGEQGNIAAETISQLKTTIPYIDRGINLEPSTGGAQQETLDRLKERVPKQLHHRDRAVTAEDMADLAYEASTDVARVKVVTPDLITNFNPLEQNFWLDPDQPDLSFEEALDQKSDISQREKDNLKETMEEIKYRAGKVKLIILPDSVARQPIPSLGLLEQVASYIRSRCEETTNIIVLGPKWQEISVTVTITPVSLEGVDLVRDTVKQRLEAFLHPLTGGSGKGWQFGRYPKKSDFYAIVQSIPEVDHVDSLTINEVLEDASLSEVSEDASLSADTLIFSGNHTVNVSSIRR
ncbi:MAG: baseplate J/gp47 family protein [Cyanobacteria bacterium P01_H01_bin.35]